MNAAEIENKKLGYFLNRYQMLVVCIQQFSDVKSQTEHKYGLFLLELKTFDCKLRARECIILSFLYLLFVTV